MVPWRAFFFAVNMAASLAVTSAAALAVRRSDGSAVAFAIAAVVALLGVAVATAELLLFAWQVRRLERALGVLPGIVGVLSFLMVIAQVPAVALYGGSRDEWALSVLFVAVAGYGSWCCYLRMRQRALPELRGFPVR
jgi:hypothetical protein